MLFVFTLYKTNDSTISHFFAARLGRYHLGHDPRRWSVYYCSSCWTRVPTPKQNDERDIITRRRGAHINYQFEYCHATYARVCTAHYIAIQANAFLHQQPRLPRVANVLISV